MKHKEINYYFFGEGPDTSKSIIIPTGVVNVNGTK